MELKEEKSSAREKERDGQSTSAKKNHQIQSHLHFKHIKIGLCKPKKKKKIINIFIIRIAIR